VDNIDMPTPVIGGGGINFHLAANATEQDG
jgi:hypothetical protein